MCRLYVLKDVYFREPNFVCFGEMKASLGLSVIGDKLNQLPFPSTCVFQSKSK